MFRGGSWRIGCVSADNVTAKDVYGSVVIVSHHPDRLPRRSPRSGAHDEEQEIANLGRSHFASPSHSGHRCCR
jgi:hypothetical protein